MDRTEDTDVRGRVRQITHVGLAVNLGLSAVKATAGWAAGSQACLADALHSLSDCVTDIAVLVGVEFWMAPADESHPHGHRRIEALVTLFIGALLAMAAIGMGTRAISSLGETHAKPPGLAVLAVAILSMGAKEILYRWTAREGARLHAPSLVANAWHHRSDALSSIPVAASVVVSRTWPSITYADHIAAILVTAMLLHAAWRIAWPSMQELTDRGAGNSARQTMIALAESVDGVKDAHELRSRRIGPGYAVDLHVLVRPDMSVKQGHDICDRVKEKLLAQGPKVIDVLVHLEPYQSPTSPRAGTKRPS